MEHSTSALLIETESFSGLLTLVEQSQTVVLFCHGWKSSIESPRNMLLAKELHKRKISTLQIIQSPASSHNINELAITVTSATSWLSGAPYTGNMRIGYMGASAGAAAIVRACGLITGKIFAIACRSGRLDMCTEGIALVDAPTLLIVGDADSAIKEINLRAQREFKCYSKIESIPLATHLFAESGTLELATELAANWFEYYARPDLPTAQKSKRSFQNRQQAGLLLAAKIAELSFSKSLSIVALPRGGVPVAHPIASQLRKPLEILLVRRLGIPGCEEQAMGAVAIGGAVVKDSAVIVKLADSLFDRIVKQEQRELEKMEKTYGRTAFNVHNCEVILVDDGIASGSTASCAIEVLKAAGAKKIHLATPVISPQARDTLKTEVDTMTVLEEPAAFTAVSLYYDDFAAPTEQTVVELLQKTTQEHEQEREESLQNVEGRDEN